MTTIGILCLLFCGCFAVVNSQSTVDETSSQCLWNNDEYVLRTLERTSRPTQQLLMQMKQQMDSMSAQLMTIKDQQPPTTGRDVGLGKQPLVSALTEQCIPLLIQQNVDGSDFFNRSWEEFKVGFNDSHGNYWLGNELLHQLTAKRRYKLRFDLQAANLSWYYAEYSTFRVDSEQTNYVLRVSGYSGNAGNDAFSYSNGMMFTTYDRDNDPWGHNPSFNNNCAVFYAGGFWYKTCANCRVNVLRGRGADFAWHPLIGLLQSSRMWLTCH